MMEKASRWGILRILPLCLFQDSSFDLMLSVTFHRLMIPVITALLLATSQIGRSQPSPLLYLHRLRNASLLVTDHQGKTLHALSPDRPMIPASTLKLLTALMALYTWGPTHRFHTDFFIDDRGTLWIKGYGDPWLTSEELDRIITALQAKGLKQVSGLGVDTSFFAGPLTVDGQSRTDNPYDATLSALAAIFNPVYVHKTATAVTSAEAQTPLTPLAERLARRLPPGKHRINLGQDTDAARYFAEVLAAKLRHRGVHVGPVIVHDRLPPSARRLYRHVNRQPLAEVVRGMLKYSNNFIANQLFLSLGAQRFQPPATLAKARRAADEFIAREFRWRRYRIVEGAGLSRQNRLSARQLVQVLERLQPFFQLLPQRERDIRAKTGTLKGVSSYAGYIGAERPRKCFALIINRPIAHDFRFRLAESLVD